MKFSDRYQYTVLCEDKKTFHFINNILKHQNINVHKIDPIISPRAAGSGEAFVRNTYIKQLKALRSTNYIKRALIVCTDADTYTVDERKKWFSTVCSSSTENIQERKENEPVMIWIPKRSIENWIEYFKNDSNDVTEDTKYDIMVTLLNVHMKPLKCLNICRIQVITKMQYSLQSKMQKTNIYNYVIARKNKEILIVFQTL